ncbi:MAG: dihydrolipoamide acetyltransferase family protein, partial [Myxococcota bacterium]
MAEFVDILIPEDQQEGTELELAAWLKEVGERVEKDEPIAELVTDKAVVELPAPATGILVEQRVAPETQVEPDAVLGRIETAVEVMGDGISDAPTLDIRAAEAASIPIPIPPSTPPAASAAPGDRPRPHPAVARRAALLGVDLGTLEGSGREGRITRSDLEPGLPAAEARPTERTSGSARPADPALGSARFVRHDPMRRSIARHMSESVHTAPHVTAVFPCDLSRVIAHRARVKGDFAERGVKLTFSAYFLRAMAEAVQEVPEVNARWHDDGLEVFEEIHVGVGTALEDQGLVVPVVRGVQARDLESCAGELTRLTDRARAGQLAPSDMRGSTLTMSNHGVMGSLFASPIIINQPESA